MSKSIPASPAKLSSGAWGACVRGAVAVGDTVTIRTQAGKTWDARVSRIVDPAGKYGTVVETVSLDRAPATQVAAGQTMRIETVYTPARRTSGRSGRRTGCSCGSREDSYGDLIPSDRNCGSCEHDV